jgi:hypothetical protein
MKISARDIQMFIAGAFALTGFYSLCWLLEYASSASDGARIFQHVIGVLLLALRRRTACHPAAKSLLSGLGSKLQDSWVKG